MSDLLIEGIIHTGDPARPRAGALLVREGRIACVGERAQCLAAAQGEVEHVDLGAGCAVPGLVDAHGHVLWYARGRREVACEDAPDAAACAARVAERARTAPAGAWLRGRGWNETAWPGAALPHAALLDRAAPRHPVLLLRVDGHAAWVNGAALAAAGIGPGTADPPGGRIVRDAAGRPTGVLVDTAMELVARLVPRPEAAELEALLLEGLEAWPRWGSPRFTTRASSRTSSTRTCASPRPGASPSASTRCWTGRRRPRSWARSWRASAASRPAAGWPSGR
jgi:predicted amidohydrolase YtcJ